MLGRLAFAFAFAFRPTGWRRSALGIMSSLSEDAEGRSARPRICMSLWPLRGAGPPCRPLITELMLVTTCGSMPRRVNDEETIDRVRDGQSPTRWRLLVQWAHEMETRTGPEGSSCRGTFHIISHWSSRWLDDPQRSQGISDAEPLRSDEHCSSS